MFSDPYCSFIAICDVLRVAYRKHAHLETEPSQLLDNVHGTVYLSSPLTDRHLSPSRNTSRLTYLAYRFGARMRLLIVQSATVVAQAAYDARILPYYMKLLTLKWH